MQTINEIFAFALANGLHKATGAELDGWCGAEGTVYLADGDDGSHSDEESYCIMFDVCEDYIAVEVYKGFMTDGPTVQLHLASTDLPM